jgi:predicted enzyme related to lactoylglutathione lyase
LATDPLQRLRENLRISLSDNRMVLLNHVALTVSDRKRSAAFYREHFGLTLHVHDDEDRLSLAHPTARSSR